MEKNMKTLFIHLSDFHITEKQNVKSIDLSLFEQAISKYKGFDEYYLVVTGDIAYSCKEKEYENAKEVLNIMIKCINSLYDCKVKVLMVPGNHDIDLTNEKVDFRDLRSLNEKEIDQKYDDYLVNMSNYFNFSSVYSLMESPITIEKNGFIDIIRINTCPFSSKEKVDEGNHFMPARYYEMLDVFMPTQNGYSILVMHHRPEWFEDVFQKKLLDFIMMNVGICFHGHDHQLKNINIESNNKMTRFIGCGEMKIINNKLIGSFNVVSVDSSDFSCVVTAYNYDSNYKSFIPLERNYSIKPNKKIFNVTNTFNDSMSITYKKDKIDLDKLFVMPFLRANSGKINNDDIKNFDELVNCIERDKHIIITGGSNTGKSSLLAKLFRYYLSHGFVPLLIRGKEVSSNDIHKILKTTFEDTYGDDKALYNLYQNMPSEKKVFVFDDFDYISSGVQQTWLKYLENKAQFYVLSTSDDLFNKKIMDLSDGCYTYTCCGLTIKQREEYIRRICMYMNVDEDYEIEKIIKAVSIATSGCSLLDITDPSLMFYLVVKIIEDKSYLEQNVADAFSIVYEHNINDALSSAGDREKLDDYHLLLQQIAYSIVTKKNSLVFDFNEFNESYLKIREEYGNISIDVNEAISVFINSQILKKVENNKYKFDHNSLISYFASSIFIDQNNMHKYDEINKLVNSINYGLNSEILLFIIYRTHSLELLRSVVTTLEKMVDGVEEINLQKKNNPFLAKTIKYTPEKEGQAETKKQLVDRLDKSEKKAISSIKKKEDSVLSNNDEAFIAKVKSITKLIEMIAKSCAGFKTILKKPERIQYMNIATSSVLKLVHMIFIISDNEANEIIDSFEKEKSDVIDKLKEKDPNDPRIRKIDKLKFEEYAYDLITTYVLNIMTFLSRLMITDKSKNFINNVYNEDNYFCYKLYQLICYETDSDKTNFLKCLIDIYESKNVRIENKYLAGRVVRMFVIHNRPSNSELDKISHITNIEKKNLLLYRDN